jgi:hypothetical protein
MVLIDSCKCDFSRGEWFCRCGYAAQQKDIIVLWTVTTVAAAVDVMKRLGVRRVVRDRQGVLSLVFDRSEGERLPNPPDINVILSKRVFAPGERHPKYTAYAWRYVPLAEDPMGLAAWRWAWWME